MPNLDVSTEQVLRDRVAQLELENEALRDFAREVYDQAIPCQVRREQMSDLRECGGCVAYKEILDLVAQALGKALMRAHGGHHYEAVRSLMQAHGRMSEDTARMQTIISEKQAEIDAWKVASGLEIAGDPDGILPRHLAAYIAEQDALCARLANARHEAARLGYCAGHSDTVNDTYYDPSEAAADICQEMEDDERMGERS
jgi:hypothetical protein